MATSFTTRQSALNSFAAQGVPIVPRAAHVSSNCCSAPARCRASAFNSNSLSDVSQQQLIAAGADASKYQRILAFVEAHATPVLPVDSTSSCDSFAYTTGEFEQPSWHNSYDEEAEEGELCNEPELMLAAAAVPAQLTSSTVSVAPVANVLNHSWSYGDAENPKPWCYAWDEEAEGSFGLSEVLSLSAQREAERRAALHEARHAARLARKVRRAQLHPQLGDLEHMQAWVGPEQQMQKQRQRSKAGLQYQQVLGLLATDQAPRQYRKPMKWHLTFDEDVHGSEAPETVLGSC